MRRPRGKWDAVAPETWFGRLVVLGLVRRNGRTRVRVSCACGKRKVVEKANLLAGRTRSCGCQQGTGLLAYNRAKARWIAFPSRAASARFVKIVDGLLLGDGCISRTGQLTVSQIDSRIDWLRQCEGQLARVGCRTRIRARTFTGWGRFGTKRIRNRRASVLSSLLYGELKAQRIRWYP